uniref:Putative carboxypeptidase n subunit 2 n=1 Tax=Rhipicephalus microplus TaxID=6941 RepID=A0A6M2D1E8_RHIMP
MTPSSRGTSHAFHGLLLLSWVIQWSSCAPSCFYSTGTSGQVTYTCSELRSSADLLDNFKPNITAGEEGRIKLLLENSVFERVPQGLFDGLGVSTLQLDNVKLTGSWSPTEPTPLRGLESTLQKVVFSHNSTVPRNWAFFAGMTELVEMVFFDMSGLRFTSSSQGDLPKTLRKLHLVRSSIASADDYWLSSLVDLQTLSLRHVNLTAFARTVLPTVAAKLETLLLEDCSLTSFPSGLDKGLPSLKYVGLQKNQIIQLGSDDVSPLINKGVVLQLRGNPLSCDCHLQFLFENSRRHSVYGQCDAPKALKGRSLRALSERDIAPCARRQASQSL